MTNLSAIIAKYITRETHKGAVNRERQLLEQEVRRWAAELIKENPRKGKT